MAMDALLPDIAALRCIEIVQDGLPAVVRVTSIRPSGQCPRCGRSATRVHSRYDRTLQDLPWQGKRTVIQWRSRKFFCDTPGCPQRIFTERVPSVTWSHGRRTCRMQETLRWLGYACGGEEGSRLAKRLGISVSADTILREVRHAPIGISEVPHVIGIDDWSFRRGHRFGTLIVDLERHRPIDLLPDRDSETVREWLQHHPGVEVVSRDRADCYAQGVSAGAPKATQVTDRWHLLKNLRDALERTVERHMHEVAKASDDMRNRAKSQNTACGNTSPTQPAVQPSSASPSASNSFCEGRRARRLEQYRQAKQLREQGKSQRDIARTLGLNRETVRRFLRADKFPERAGRHVCRTTDTFREYLHRRWAEGCHNARILTAELWKQGFQGSYYAVRRTVARWRTSIEKGDGSKRTAIAKKPSARRVAWLLFLRANELDDYEQSFVESLERQCPRLKDAANLAHDFIDIVKQRRADALDAWLERATGTASPSNVCNFAQGLKSDRAAVAAALTLSWSNGQVEGQVNRLKLVKRQMYGRAKLDLLKMRFLHSGYS